ncbi:MAG: alpha/beta hydrolase [Acholeplasmatales bacterium]|nr:MAG: alpha/beta hydrolase [Acholeplasmatales bacterium]
MKASDQKIGEHMTTVALIGLFIILEYMAHRLPTFTRITQRRALCGTRVLMLGIVLTMVVVGYSDYRFVYSGFFVVFIMVSVKYGILLGRKLPFKSTKRRHVVFMSVVWLLVFSPFVVFPKYAPLPATGPYAVSVIAYSILDPVSHEAFTHRHEQRDIMVYCYYPQGALEDKPLILYSHGGISTPLSNESLLLEIASHGYVACTVSHPFHTLRAQSSTGKSIRMDTGYFNELMRENVHQDIAQSFEYYQKWMALRTHDLGRVIDDLLIKQQEHVPFVAHSDLTQVIVIGHSLGGSAALCMPWIHEEVRAVVALESPYLCDIERVEDGAFIYKAPHLRAATFHLYSDTIYDTLSDWPQYERNLEMIALNDANHQHLRIQGSGHFSLTDLGLMSPILTRFLNRHATELDNKSVLRIVNIEVLAFIQSVAD